MTKTVIGPIVSFLIIAMQLIFGITIPPEIGGQITEWIVVGASLAGIIYGIIKNHRKPQEPVQKHFP